jgi:hypothetical protein
VIGYEMEQVPLLRSAPEDVVSSRNRGF